MFDLVKKFQYIITVGSCAKKKIGLEDQLTFFLELQSVQEDQNMSRIVLRNANLLDGENAMQPSSSVAIDGNKISEIGLGKTMALRSDDQVFDLQGQTLMPGLCIGHYHGAYRNYGAEGGSQEASGVEQAFMALNNIQIALNCGYTNIISAGTHYNIDAELVEAMEAGDLVGPRLIPCSKNFMPAPDESLRMDNEEICMAWGPDEFRAGALKELERGAKIIKIFASGGHGAGPSKGMKPEEIGAVVEVAKDYGARVRAHVTGKTKIMSCVNKGVEILDHADGLDQKCMEEIVDKGCFVLPSMYVLLKCAELEGNHFGFDTKLRAFDMMCEALPKMISAGIKLVPGDDFGLWQIPHGTYAEELICYRDHAGIQPLELIKWATVYGGEMNGIEKLGRVRAGYLADLLILNGDPSQDIAVLADSQAIQCVMKDGQFVSGNLSQSKVAA